MSDRACTCWSLGRAALPQGGHVVFLSVKWLIAQLGRMNDSNPVFKENLSGSGGLTGLDLQLYGFTWQMAFSEGGCSLCPLVLLLFFPARTWVLWQRHYCWNISLAWNCMCLRSCVLSTLNNCVYCWNGQYRLWLWFSQLFLHCCPVKGLFLVSVWLQALSHCWIDSPVTTCSVHVSWRYTVWSGPWQFPYKLRGCFDRV